MRNKLFVLNTLLAGLTLSVVWTLQAQYESDCRSSAALAETPIKLLPDLPGADIVKPAAFNGSEYVAVTQKNLFTVDRNSEPIVDAPPPPIIRTMPALPVVTGVLGMPSGMVAIVSEKSDGSSRTVRVGEKIGEFRLIALTQRHVSIEWEGRMVEKSVEELMDRGQSQVPHPPMGQLTGQLTGQLPEELAGNDTRSRIAQWMNTKAALSRGN